MKIDFVSLDEIISFFSLKRGLKSQFAQVSVELVNCPDLREPPFYFTARGLCGNEVTIDIGGTNSFAPSQRDKIYPFKDMLTCIGRHQLDTFVIGAGVCPRPSNGEIGELFMNACFSPINEKFWNNSHIGYVKEDTKGFMLEHYNNPNPVCSMQGNFFISDGFSGPVLKIWAKKRTGEMDFIDTMMHSLYQVCTEAGSTNALIGLGGTFVISNARVRFHVMPNSWPYHEESNYRNRVIQYYIDQPMRAVGTFFNKDSWFGQITPQESPIKLCFTQKHFHAITEHVAGGHYHSEIDSPDTVEYLGYFVPAKKLYLIDSKASRT